MSRADYFRKKPLNDVLYTTLEVYHPDVGVKRVVTMQQAAKSLALESNAPRNPSESVTFEPVGFVAPQPEIGEDGDVSLSIAIQDGAKELRDWLRGITDAGRLTPIQLIWRQHLASGTAPEVVLRFQLAGRKSRGATLAFRAEQVNPAVRQWLRVYKEDDFPGLRQR